MTSRDVPRGMAKARGRPLKQLPENRETREPGLHERLREIPEPPAKRKPGRPRSSFLTVDDLASWLKVSRTTVYGLIAAGLPYLRVGSVRRFDQDAVRHWLERFTEHRQAADLE